MWIHLLPCGTGIGTSFSHLVVRPQGEQWSSLMGIVSTILITHSEPPDTENWKVLNIALFFFRHRMTHSRDKIRSYILLQITCDQIHSVSTTSTLHVLLVCLLQTLLWGWLWCAVSQCFSSQTLLYGDNIPEAH